MDLCVELLTGFLRKKTGIGIEPIDHILHGGILAWQECKCIDVILPQYPCGQFEFVISRAIGTNDHAFISIGFLDKR